MFISTVKEHFSEASHWKDKLALIISAGLSPFVIIPAFIFIVCWSFSPNIEDFFKFFGICIFFSTIVPFVNVYIAVKYNKITDIHVCQREQRTEPFIVAIGSIAVGTYLLHVLDAPREIVILGIAMGINGILFFLITQFWKISMHASILAGVLVSLMVLVNYRYGAFFILIPPMIWARTHRKRHTLYQGLLATLLATLGTFIVYKLFDYPR